MKMKSAFLGALFAAASLLSANAFSADAEKATEPAVPKVKPHSHMQEKTGIAPPTNDVKKSTPTDGKVTADGRKSDKRRHLHPRDGK